MSAWYETIGKEGDIVMSTRIRLARNVAGIPFPARWSEAQAVEVTGLVRDAMTAGSSKLPWDFEFLNLDNAPENSKRMLVEDHLMSHEMLQGKYRALLLNKQQNISIMLGEEDHIRLQAILPGLDLEEAMKIANLVDDVIAERANYAFDEEFGYLTRCPTNVGTGLRASVMLHLPALKMTGQMNSLVGAAGKLGLTIRGLYGEGSGASGDLYQLSNQVTLGISEQQTIDKLGSITQQIITSERQARQRLLAHNPVTLPDKLYRAYGTLRYARSMSSEECRNLLSEVRLGVSMGIIKEVDAQTVSKLLVTAEPAHINDRVGDELPPEGRDKARSDILRAAMGGMQAGID